MSIVHLLMVWSLCVGLITGFFIGTRIERANQYDEAIAHHTGHYDPLTAEFKWGAAP